MNGGVKEVPTLRPPLGWRFIGRLSPLALPERFDAWSAARVRARLDRTAVIRPAPALLFILGVLALGGVRARVRTGFLTAILVFMMILFAIVLASVPAQSRRLLAFLDHAPDRPRPHKGRRSRGWLIVAGAAFNLVNFGVQAVLPYGAIHEEVVAAFDGPGCRAPSRSESARVASALGPGASASGLSVVRAGSSRAIGFHASGLGEPNADLAVVLDPPGFPGLPAILIVDRSAPGAPAADPVTHAVLRDLGLDLPAVVAGPRPGEAVAVPMSGFSWHGFYRNPIPEALACVAVARSDAVRRLNR